MTILRLIILPFIVALTVWSSPIRAVDPVHAINQYGHRVWRVGEAGLTATPTSIAQTPDGQIWVATTDGLFRFDGKQFSAWKLPGGGAPSGYIEMLLGTSNGDLYVSARSGLYRISHERVFKYPKFLDKPGHLVQDDSGTVWIADLNYHSGPGVCSVGRATLKCYGPREGMPCSGNMGFTPGVEHDLWIGGNSGICHWRVGRSSRVYPIGDRNAIVTGLFLDAHRSLWSTVPAGSPTSGLWNFTNGMWHRLILPGFDSRHLDIWTSFADRQGSIWIGAAGKGLYRLINGRLDHFDKTDGLSDDTVDWILEDRENAIWITTPQGVEQFFDQPITRFIARADPLSGHAVWLSPSPDGAVLASDHMSSDKMFSDGSVKSIARSSHGNVFHTSFIDSTGRTWLGTETKLLVIKGGSGRIDDATDPLSRGGMYVSKITEDTRHSVWAAGRDWRAPPVGRLWRFENGRLVQRIETPANAGHDSVSEIASDLAGGLWAVLGRHGLYSVRDGAFKHVASFSDDKLITQVFPVAAGEAWLATASGAVWLKDGHSRFLDIESGLPCDHVYGVVLDSSGDLWLATQCALVRISASEVHLWQVRPSHRVRLTALGTAAGYVGSERSRLVRSKDGALWFIGGFSSYRVDPAHIPVNHLPPPIRLQSVEADERTYDPAAQIHLPKLTRNLEIDYAGLSYLQPDLLKFRYRLFGHDQIWNDVGNRRQAFYNDLPPGDYRFQVTACNKDGVCNNTGASTLLVIPPAWWQTWLFRTLCAIVLLCLLGMAIRWRIGAYAEAIRLRFDDRLLERTRVARDLHDTLLQSVLASKLLAEDGETIRTVPEGQATFKRLAEWLAHAAEEGRAAVESLRTSPEGPHDLEKALELTALRARTSPGVVIDVATTGAPREMHPLVRNEIFRIGAEAIRNSCAHSGASQIAIALGYDQKFTLRVRDNGKGIDEDVLRAGKAGHFGLVGMRERAEQIRGKLEISSSPGGTDVHLIVPGDVAFCDKLRLAHRLRRFLLRRVRARPRRGSTSSVARS